MCYRLDSSASAISAGWLIDAAAHRSRSACNCWLNQVDCSKLNLRKKALAHHAHSGHVPNAAARWFSSNGSAPGSFAYGPRLFLLAYNHHSIFLIIAAARLPSLSPYVCLRGRGYGCDSREIHLTTASGDPHGRSIFPIASFLYCFRNSKYIARRFHNGFLQVAVSKTIRRSRSCVPRNPPRRIVPDTALRLERSLRGRRFA
jgi:hypothetical protein